MALRVRHYTNAEDGLPIYGAKYNLGDIYLARGKYALAEKNFCEGIQGCCRDDNGADDGSLMLRSDLALAYLGQGKYLLAEALLRHVLKVTRGARSPEHPTTLRTLASLTTAEWRKLRRGLIEANRQVLAIAPTMSAVFMASDRLRFLKRLRGSAPLASMMRSVSRSPRTMSEKERKRFKAMGI